MGWGAWRHHGYGQHEMIAMQRLDCDSRPKLGMDKGQGEVEEWPGYGWNLAKASRSANSTSLLPYCTAQSFNTR